MATYFSSACKDERGKYTGGKAGDQTGKEVRTTKAYNHKLGWRIFRHPNPNIAYWIGTNARVMADNNCFGYDQLERLSGYNRAKAAGWEPKNVKSLCELDCSSFVRTAVACALEKDIPNFNTASEPSVLLNLGFVEITGTPLSQLQLGDIVCTPRKGHTEIVSSGATATVTTTVSCYPAYTGNSKSIAYALNSIGVDGSYSHRKKIAQANGISGYVGTASQNIRMLNMLKTGQLRKA